MTFDVSSTQLVLFCIGSQSNEVKNEAEYDVNDVELSFSIPDHFPAKHSKIQKVFASGHSQG